MDSNNKALILPHTATIVSAYVSRHVLPTAELPQLIGSVYAALGALGQAPVPEEAPVELKPAVPIRKSVTPDYIVCLEDGKKLKMLKRHLSTAYGLTPDQYRRKWGLPDDYPLVAPNYAKSRSELAVNLGLGRRKAAA